MQTSTSVLQFSLVLILSFNTWALADRALFSFGGKIFYQSEVNEIVKTFDYLECENYRLDLIRKYIEEAPKEISKVVRLEDKSHSKLTSLDKKSARSVASIIQLIRYSKSEAKLKLNKKKKCGYNETVLKYGPYIVGSRNYLKNSVISSAQNDQELIKSLNNFKVALEKEDPIRFYFNGQ